MTGISDTPSKVPERSPFSTKPWTPRIERWGRWRWRGWLEDGVMERGPGMSGLVMGWFSFSRGHLERKLDRKAREANAE